MIGNKIKLNLGKGFRLKKEGTFNLDKLLKEVMALAKKRKYLVQIKDHTDKSEKAGHDIIIVWTLEKNINEYIKYESKIEFLLRRINKTESNVAGSNQITFTADLITDYNSKLKHTKFLKVFGEIYNTFIIRNKIEKHKKKLLAELTELRDLAKLNIDMHT
ncbi:hypothetical protein HOD61_03245 [archaeon]|jgi:hypothetical protein|nr:hypothetical protein [archaeon]